MKTKLISFLIAAVLATQMSAQSVQYSYDDAGNRISREIVMDSRSTEEEDMPEIFTETISGKEFLIYPNPTKGMLKVEVLGYETADEGNIQLYGMNGQLVISIPITYATTDMDISMRPNGIYLMHISLNGKETIWKIIKQ